MQNEEEYLQDDEEKNEGELDDIILGLLKEDRKLKLEV